MGEGDDNSTNAQINDLTEKGKNMNWSLLLIQNDVGYQ